jgi:hypothetical protein
MKRSMIYVIFIIALMLLPPSGLSFLSPFIFNNSKGTIEVNWGNPTGLKLNSVLKGDKIKLLYNSDMEINVYLLTKDQASEFRAPSIYKDPLPEPLISGNNGTLEIEFTEAGDYELLFLPDRVFNTFEVEYEIERFIKKEISIYILSGICLLLTALMLVVLGTVLIKRQNNEVMHK